MDEGRRSLLKALAVTALAGCTPTRPSQPTTPALPSPSPLGTATHSPSPSPTPSVAASVVPSPSPSPTPSPAPTVRPVISRELLGLPDPLPGGTPHTISGLMLHHTAAPVVEPSRAPDRFRSHTRGHRDAGFVDVAYHWGVDTGGSIYQLRDVGIAGETFTDYDPAGWFLVVCEGNFEEAAPTDAMLAAVADVFAAGAQQYGVAPSTLVGHRDRAATACPGDNLQRMLPELVGMVEQRLANGGVVLEVTDDPAALP